MAIAKEKVLGSVNTTFLDECEIAIDGKMGDPQKVGAMRRGVPGRHYWNVVLYGTLTESEKVVLAKRYTDAGWNNVKVSNSSDHGEHPGLWSIELHE